MDSIARGMAELASVSGAPAAGTATVPLSSIGLPSRPQEAPPSPTATAAQPLVEIAADDMSKCTNCRTCYQDLSELFEKTKIIVDGQPKEVSRVIPGVLEKVELTAELIHRASRVADDCDAEIIRFHRPT